MMNERPANFLSGSPLNRFSWLRPSPAFLNALASSSSALYLPFSRGAPLTAFSRSTSTSSLLALPTLAVAALLGPAPLFGQTQEPGEAAPAKTPQLEAARLRGVPLVFLGVREPVGEPNALPPAGADPEELARTLHGAPYFAIDVSDVSEEELSGLVSAGSDMFKGERESDVKVSFAEARASTRGMSAFDAAVFAQARSMVDWNARNRFCASCGAPLYSLWAGWKLACSSLLPWADNGDKEPCLTATGLHNIAHPRTDSVVIMAVVNEANDRILLGHNRKFPGKFYSTLAGFIEPGESFEDAVRREILEEAGIHVWNVRYHSTQPWPYPANLMAGFIATGDPAEPVRTDLDNELADARWFTRAEILTILAHPDGTNITRRDYQRLSDAVDKQSNVTGDKQANTAATATSDAPLAGDAAQAARAAQPEAKRTDDEPAIRVPPETAIAGVLIADWAHGRLPSAGSAARGHL